MLFLEIVRERNGSFMLIKWAFGGRIQLRKKKKKEIIVKTVFTCICIFLLWWGVLIWERFADDIAVDHMIDDVSMQMLWHDLQNKRSIPVNAKIENFSLAVDHKKVITKFMFTVYGEKMRQPFQFFYSEAKGTKRSFTQTEVENIDRNVLEAAKFFHALQILQNEGKKKKNSQLIFSDSYTPAGSADKIWKIEGNQLIVTTKDSIDDLSDTCLWLEADGIVQCVWVAK